MDLPKRYKWLLDVKEPQMLVEAVKLYGTMEVTGKDNNPIIIGWAKEIGSDIAKVYTVDEIPWCGLFMAVVAKRAGYEPVKNPLRALNWGNFGIPVQEPILGDVLVFERKTTNGGKAGHVGLFVGKEAGAYLVLGGNQSDKVIIVKIRDRLVCVRRENC